MCGAPSLTVPVHHGKYLAKGTLREIISKSGFSVKEFKDALQGITSNAGWMPSSCICQLGLLMENADSTAKRWCSI